MGHVTAARLQGYSATLHYGSMSWQSPLKDSLDVVRGRYTEAIAQGLDFPGRTEYLKMASRNRGDSLWIFSGGPLQTMLIGSAGFYFICYRRQGKSFDKFGRYDWLGVFFALFLLREIFNLITSVSRGLLSGSGRYFAGDEYFISRMLHLSGWELPVGCGLAGLMICAYTVFQIVPRTERLSLIIGGLVGGITGYAGWMYLLGPWLLP